MLWLASFAHNYYFLIVSLTINLEVGRPEVYNVRALLSLLTGFVVVVLFCFFGFPCLVAGGLPAPDLVFSHDHIPRKEQGRVAVATVVPFACPPPHFPSNLMSQLIV